MREKRVVVVGPGYLGLPLAMRAVQNTLRHLNIALVDVDGLLNQAQLVFDTSNRVRIGDVERL